MTARWDVLGIGIVAVDDLVYVAHYPIPDSKQPILAKDRQGGGPTATALVAMARQRLRAAYCTVLGNDELSRFSVEELEKEGVSCAPVIRRPEARPYHSIIVVDRGTGLRTILYSAEGVTDPWPDEISEELVASCRLLFVDAYRIEPVLRAAEIAAKLGIPIVADIDDGAIPGVERLMTLVDHLVVGTALAGQVTGKRDPVAMTAELARAGRTCTVVTGGAAGCWYAEHGGDVKHFPAYEITTVDTTGCGDVFHGVYAAAIVQGTTIETAIQKATAAAALKAMQPGGRKGIPDQAAIDRFLAERGAR